MKDLKASVPGCKCGGAATARTGTTNNTHIRDERRMEREENVTFYTMVYTIVNWGSI